MEKLPNQSQEVQMIPYESVVRSIINSDLHSIDSFIEHLFPEATENQMVNLKEYLVEVALRGVDIGLSLNCNSIEEEIGFYLQGLDDGQVS